jgi:DNA-binding HxlR family transcriptional regulator
MPDTPPVSRHDALATALEAVGDRWSMLVVAALLDGPRRFGDLEREVEGIAPNVLSARLRALEDEGVVVAEPYSERPPRFLYSLTAAGVELAGAIRLLADWGARRREGAEPLRHAACDTPLEARLWCPTCERPVEAPETDELHFA